MFNTFLNMKKSMKMNYNEHTIVVKTKFLQFRILNVTLYDT